MTTVGVTIDPHNDIDLEVHLVTAIEVEETSVTEEAVEGSDVAVVVAETVTDLIVGEAATEAMVAVVAILVVEVDASMTGMVDLVVAGVSMVTVVDTEEDVETDEAVTATFGNSYSMNMIIK